MSMVEARYTYGPGTFEVSERGDIVIEDCPATIDERLRRARFTEKTPSTFIKTQRPLDNDDRSIEVVEVTIQGSNLHVSAHDVVGRINLTPEAKLSIEPKLSWKSILDMLLAVHNRGRTVDYHGVPIDSFLSDELELEDIFPILGTNFLQGIETIHRNGFIRDVVMRRSDLLDPRGKIDVGRTLVNHAEGSLKQHCVVNEIEYDNVANSILHYAGTILLQLFRENSEKYEYPAYRYIFSQIQREVDHLERLGVGSSVRRLPAYRSFSLNDLPKQRHYYERSMDVSKAILSSSIGTPMSGGQRELTIDYVLNMESLFEQYSQVVIQSQLERVQGYDALDETINVSASRSPTVNPFYQDSSVHHQPDHALERGDETVAVMDSKYYAKGHDPVADSSARSRLFSYAYLLDTKRLAFLCPLLEPKRRRVERTGADLQVVSPLGEFTLDTYDEVVHEYVFEVLRDDYPVLEAFRAVDENKLCLDGVAEGDLDEISEMNGPFNFRDARDFSLRVIKAAADDHSWDVRNRSDLEQGGEWTRDQIEARCDARYEHTTTCVPVFSRNEETSEEWIDLYFVDNGTGEVEEEGPLKLY